MSGWGNKDDKTSTGTIALSAAGAVTGTSTAFTTEAAVGDILTANSIDFRITAIASNTACTVVDAEYTRCNYCSSKCWSSIYT